MGWWWLHRMSQWSNLLKVDHPSVHLLSSRASQKEYYAAMYIPWDTRAYAMVIRNDGEILWASHDKFKEHLQEKEMVQTVHREQEWRIYEQDRLLGTSSRAGAIAAPSSPAESVKLDGEANQADDGSSTCTESQKSDGSPI